jgi:DNA-binding NarL/FixJ family response regulator
MVRKRAGVKADLELYELEVGGERFVVMSLPARVSGHGYGELTAAEREVAEDAAGGLSNAAIAKKRGRSARTIANQLASVYRKLGVASRAELAVRSRQSRGSK